MRMFNVSLVTMKAALPTTIARVVLQVHIRTLLLLKSASFVRLVNIPTRPLLFVLIVLPVVSLSAFPTLKELTGVPIVLLVPILRSCPSLLVLIVLRALTQLMVLLVHVRSVLLVSMRPARHLFPVTIVLKDDSPLLLDNLVALLAKSALMQVPQCPQFVLLANLAVPRLNLVKRPAMTVRMVKPKLPRVKPFAWNATKGIILAL